MAFLRLLVASSWLLSGLVAHAATPVPSSWAEGAFDEGDARVEARLLVHPERGEDGSVRAGVRFTLDPGWHLYWHYPGDAGLPTELRWRGARAGPLAWPAPSIFQEGEGTLVTYGYAGDVLLSAELRPERGAERIGVDVEALACRTVCIPASFSLERSLDAEDGKDRAAAVRRLFAVHAEKLPKRAAAIGLSPEVSVVDRLRLALTLEPCREGPADAPCRSLAAPAFVPARPGLGVMDATDSGGRIEVLIARESGDTERLEGVLSLRGGDGRLHHLAIDLAPGAAWGIAWGPFFSALALAFLGGLLLNLMPCVLPVLALKAFAVAELGGRDRRHALEQAGTYTAGVVASMLALAVVVLLLRRAGHEVGWGFQLQEPAFVAVVAVVCTIFALNLLGVFEISFVPSGLARVGAEASGARRSFFEGLLAVALATPCSAPFLGPAVGLAFASPAPFVPIVFVAIGLGLAAPFVVVCAFPGARRWLPRPGRWMTELRSLLGFALLATVIWLAWVLGRSAGVDAQAALLVLLLSVALAVWIFGKLERRDLRGAVFALGLGVVAFGSNHVTVAPALPIQASASVWKPETLARLRAAGRPVVVVFTADWCLTCKWNERTVLASAPVRASLERGGFTLLVADWTRRDEDIRRELARFGRAGVPLTLVYHADADEPQLLPELLTVEAMLAALEPGEARHAQAAGAADGS